MILHLRNFVLLSFVLTLLAACAEPLLEAEQAQKIVPRNIVVDVSQIQGIVGRSITVAPEQIKADLDANLRRTLTRPGTPNADIELIVTEVRLKSPGEAFLFAGNSYIQGTLRVTDSQTGAVILPATEVKGISEQIRLGGLVGVAMSPPAQQDYEQTIRGFSKAIQNRLFGKPGDA